MNKLLLFSSLLFLHIHVLGQTEENWFTNVKICETQDTTISFPTGDFNNYTFKWHFNNDSLSVDSSITPSTSGLYKLELYGNDTLYDEFEVIVDKENPEFIIELQDSDLNIDSLMNTCYEDNPTLYTVERGDQFAWYLNEEPMESETDSTLSIIEIIDQIEYNQEYKYSLTLKNSCGIYTSDNSLHIIFNECNCALEMPNVFTPNNDSKNNVFKPLNNHEDETDKERICESTNYSMNIYNQWGKHMASVESGNELPSWNGKNKKGNEVAEGVYFYNIVYQVNVYTAPKQMEYTGSFHLYR